MEKEEKDFQFIFYIAVLVALAFIIMFIRWTWNAINNIYGTVLGIKDKVNGSSSNPSSGGGGGGIDVAGIIGGIAAFL